MAENIQNISNMAYSFLRNISLHFTSQRNAPAQGPARVAAQISWTKALASVWRKVQRAPPPNRIWRYTQTNLTPLSATYTRSSKVCSSFGIASGKVLEDKDLSYQGLGLLRAAKLITECGNGQVGVHAEVMRWNKVYLNAYTCTCTSSQPSGLYPNSHQSMDSSLE